MLVGLVLAGLMAEISGRQTAEGNVKPALIINCGRLMEFRQELMMERIFPLTVRTYGQPSLV